MVTFTELTAVIGLGKSPAGASVRMNANIPPAPSTQWPGPSSPQAIGPGGALVVADPRGGIGVSAFERGAHPPAARVDILRADHISDPRGAELLLELLTGRLDDELAARVRERRAVAA